MKNRLHHVLLAAVSSLSLCLLAGPVDAALVYTQNATYPGLFNAWTSSSASGTSENQQWTTYDDFALTGSANIQKVLWQGFYLGNTGNLPNTDQWHLNVYSSTTTNGIPTPDLLNPLATASVSGSNVARAAQGYGVLSDGTQVLVYNFEAIVHDFFLADASTRYWLAIESQSSTNDPVWAWMSGQPGNGTSLQQQEGSSSYFQRSGDRAFALYSDTNALLTDPGLFDDPDSPGNFDFSSGGFSGVPEPSTWIMFATMGLAASLFQFVRLRRRVRDVG